MWDSVEVLRGPEPIYYEAVTSGELGPQHVSRVVRVEGTVAIVAPTARLADLGEQLAGLLEHHPDRLRLLDGLDTKGLEFDGVVVVDADGITEESSAGWRTLYVVLTRATQLLTTVGTTDRWLSRIA